MIIQALDFGLGTFESLICTLGFWVMRKYPLNIWMRIGQCSLGKFRHVGFDTRGGDIEILQIEKDFHLFLVK